MIIIVITDALHWFIFLFFFLLLIVHFLDLFSFSLLVATFLNFFFQLITCLGFFSFFSFFLGTDQSDDTICTKQEQLYCYQVPVVDKCPRDPARGVQCILGLCSAVPLPVHSSYLCVPGTAGKTTTALANTSTWSL